MRKWRVLCTENLSRAPDALAPTALADVEDQCHDHHFLLGNVAQYDAFIASALMRLERAMIDEPDRWKVVAAASTGTDHLDVPAPKRVE